MWLGGELWLTSSEASNAASDYSTIIALTRRNITGTVAWGGTTERVAGATVRAYDNDLVGREFMGQATTSGTGAFAMSYNGRKSWDTIGTYPDIVVEVWLGGVLWHTSLELPDVSTNTALWVDLTRIQVNGSASWLETCAPASALLVEVRRLPGCLPGCLPACLHSLVSGEGRCVVGPERWVCLQRWALWRPAPAGAPLQPPLPWRAEGRAGQPPSPPASITLLKMPARLSPRAGARRRHGGVGAPGQRPHRLLRRLHHQRQLQARRHQRRKLRPVLRLRRRAGRLLALHGGVEHQGPHHPDRHQLCGGARRLADHPAGQHRDVEGRHAPGVLRHRGGAGL